MKSIRVGIDVSNLHTLSKGRGIGFYTSYLVESLKKYTDIDVIVIEEKNNTEKINIIHYPFFDFFRPTLPLIKKHPTVVTIHDVTPLLFPKQYPPGLKGNLKLSIQKLALKRVDAVITDSLSSKKDIQRILKVNSEKIHSIYLSQAPHFKVLKDKDYLNKVKRKFKLPDSFALYTGSTNWNKNIVNLTKGCLDAGFPVVLVGKGFETTENLDHPELRELKRFMERFSNHPQVFILGFVSDQELVAIMNLGTALLFPSRYEGFGLTVLEAQSCGLPVITSDISSLPEVAGKDGAIFVNPESTQAISDTVELLFTRKEKQRELQKKGFENIKRFSWEKVALETAKVYEQVLKKGK